MRYLVEESSAGSSPCLYLRDMCRPCIAGDHCALPPVLGDQVLYSRRKDFEADQAGYMPVVVLATCEPVKARTVPGYADNMAWDNSVAWFRAHAPEFFGGHHSTKWLCDSLVGACWVSANQQHRRALAEGDLEAREASVALYEARIVELKPEVVVYWGLLSGARLLCVTPPPAHAERFAREATKYLVLLLLWRTDPHVSFVLFADGVSSAGQTNYGKDELGGLTMRTFHAGDGSSHTCVVLKWEHPGALAPLRGDAAAFRAASLLSMFLPTLLVEVRLLIIRNQSTREFRASVTTNLHPRPGFLQSTRCNNVRNDDRAGFGLQPREPGPPNVGGAWQGRRCDARSGSRARARTRAARRVATRPEPRVDEVGARA